MTQGLESQMPSTSHVRCCCCCGSQQLQFLLRRSAIAFDVRDESHPEAMGDQQPQQAIECIEQLIHG